ncbi:lactonase family protein [Clostridium pasteurianum]|uniref:3-carboxymuconate cyclase n=1 Tax=Clostridium pasteurianum BC1 TaxID=86416 RepID=R4K8F9_CLOPA|nr:beta-propeller fold lactonase family protein [Clostridium pasteurianum]AGK99457.1 3-carboxymuconate cyclase [Clostridium pasteurianum BC1]
MYSVRNCLPIGMVYVMTNSANKNEIAAFHRVQNGALSPMGFYDTYGLGSGPNKVSPATPDHADPLTSQGSLVLSRDRHFLFAVNAGSHSISSFMVTAGGELILVEVVPSGGLQPNSLTVYEDLLYVSNVGSKENGYQSNITGFRIGNRGQLARIPGSTRKLSTINAQPSCVLFSPNGYQLVVSELTTNRLSVFHVKNDGTLSGPQLNNSNGTNPFGSCFLSSGLLLVAEASGAMSSYAVIPDGELRVISGSVSDRQMLTCWVSPTRDGRYAYTSNTASGTVTTYRINMNGTLNAIGSIRSTAGGMAMGEPIDNGVSWDGLNFYVLNGSQGSISVFYIGENGQLMLLQVADHMGLPTFGTQGLAVI